MYFVNIIRKHPQTYVEVAQKKKNLNQRFFCCCKKLTTRRIQDAAIKSVYTINTANMIYREQVEAEDVSYNSVKVILNV